LNALWEDVCLRKLYLTGGIGPSRHNEGFTQPYDLPNETAYAETCAAVGLVFWNNRLLQIDCNRKNADIIERALFNGILSGVSLDGERFFYENPLASIGDVGGKSGHHRQPWFDCACCPPNLARLVASLGSYLYSTEGEILAVHQFANSKLELEVNGQALTLYQETEYPWSGQVGFRFAQSEPVDLTIKLRLPGWCRFAQVFLNGAEFPGAENGLEEMVDAGGYINLKRTWLPGDHLQFEMDMPIERVYAHPAVRQDSGLVALQRGPLVYCLEQVDHSAPLAHIRLPDEVELHASYQPDFLGGIVILEGETVAVSTAGWEDSLYRMEKPSLKPTALTAVPYFAWDNREPGAMQVWLPVEDWR
jgi:DUF1680 family protein